MYFALNGISDTINLVKDHFELWIIGLLIFAVSGVVLAVVHEGIHALFWAMGTENHFKDIEFGFIKEKSKGKDVIIMDHPTEVGLIVYEK